MAFTTALAGNMKSEYYLPGFPVALSYDPSTRNQTATLQSEYDLAGVPVALNHPREARYPF